MVDILINVLKTYQSGFSISRKLLMNKKERKGEESSDFRRGSLSCLIKSFELCKYAKENERRADYTANTITLIIPILSWTRRIPENSHLMGF